MEKALNWVIVRTKQNRSFKGIMTSHMLYISHVLFIDDILIFCNGSLQDADKLKQSLELFLCATGMQISARKPSMSRCNINKVEILHYKNPIFFSSDGLWVWNQIFGISTEAKQLQKKRTNSGYY